jgi:hypothetical protein
MFHHNAVHAERVSLFALGQRWRVLANHLLGEATVDHLLEQGRIADEAG